PPNELKSEILAVFTNLKAQFGALPIQKHN
ncbi:MAG: hypothetical protein ACI9UV_001180, partial [Algoriphagus sp.]